MSSVLWQPQGLSLLKFLGKSTRSLECRRSRYRPDVTARFLNQKKDKVSCSVSERYGERKIEDSDDRGTKNVFEAHHLITSQGSGLANQGTDRMVDAMFFSRLNTSATNQIIDHVQMKKKFVSALVPLQSPWLRDVFIPIAGNKAYVPYVGPLSMGYSLIAQALRGADKQFITDNGTEVFRENGISDPYSLASENPEQIFDALARVGLDVVKGRTCVEGGNLISLTKPNGNLGAVIGEESLYTSMAILDNAEDVKFSPEERSRINELAHSTEYSEELLDETIKRLEAYGDSLERIIKERIVGIDDVPPIITDPRPGTKGYVFLLEIEGRAAIVPVEARGYTQEMAYTVMLAQLACRAAREYGANYQIGPTLPPEEKIEKAKIFLAKLQLSKETIAKELDIEASCVTYVEQPETHIDLYAKAAPNGTIMVQDFDLTVRLLDKMVKSNDPKFKKHKKTFKTFRRVARQMEKAKKDLLNNMIAALLDGGYNVVRMPGIFGTNVPKPEINFFGSISATDESGTVYDMNNDSAIPVLNDLIASVHQDLGFDEIYYLGANGKEDQVSATDALGMHRGSTRCLAAVKNKEVNGNFYDRYKENQRI